MYEVQYVLKVVEFAFCSFLISEICSFGGTAALVHPKLPMRLSLCLSLALVRPTPLRPYLRLSGL
jgi:hypothetical protein